MGSLGQQITITTTVKNQGSGTSGGFYVSVYLSANSTIDTSDLAISTKYAGSLNTGEQRTLTINATIPAILVPGAYYLGAIADTGNRIAESNEGNNSLAGNQITVVSEVDLVITSVSAPSSAGMGQLIPVTATVKNQGSGNAGEFYVTFYLSTDSTITSDDIEIRSGYVSSLDGGGQRTVTVDVSLDPAFSTLVIDKNIPGTTRSYIPETALASNAQYYWRVRAFNTENEVSSWSEVRSYRTLPLLAAPPRPGTYSLDPTLPTPGIISPVDQSTAGSLLPVLDWMSVAGSTSYIVQVSVDPASAPSATIVSATTTESDYEFLKNAPAGITLYWRVLTVSTNRMSSWSSVHTLLSHEIVEISIPQFPLGAGLGSAPIGLSLLPSRRKRSHPGN